MMVNEIETNRFASFGYKGRSPSFDLFRPYLQECLLKSSAVWELVEEYFKSILASQKKQYLSKKGRIEFYLRHTLFYIITSYSYFSFP